MALTFITLLLGALTVLNCHGFQIQQPSNPVNLISLMRQRHTALMMAQTEQKPTSITVGAAISRPTQPSKRESDNKSRQAANTTSPTGSQRSNTADKIKALADSGEWKQAKELFMSRNRPNLMEFAAIIFGARVCKEQSDGMAFYDRMVRELSQSSVNLYIYDHVIAMNLDYGDDARALEIFSDLLNAEKVKKEKLLESNLVATKLTPASEINLQKIIFNALRASLSIQFQNTKDIQKKDQSNKKDALASVDVIVKQEEVEFYDISIPSKNRMEKTISSIKEQKWVFLPKDKSLIVRAYASWNMTTQLAEMTDFIFQDPLPDLWTLETYMKTMLDIYPELALLSLQWYLPIINPENPSIKKVGIVSVPENTASVSDPLFSEVKGTETILSSIISNKIMTEKRKGKELHSYQNTEPVSARILGQAVKALARLDYFVGKIRIDIKFAKIISFFLSSLIF